jgi:Copper binding periplasmic protein CusF
MLQSISMTHVGGRRAAVLGLLALVAVPLAAPAVSAQDRGEEILGTITRVDGGTVIVKREGAPDVRIRITPGTVVEFSDSGDRKLFPNPSYRDLRSGMGVRFTYGTGTPERIVVHYVPSATAAPGPPAAGTEQIKVRILSVSRGGREFRADVAGTPRTFIVDNAADTRAVRNGELVVLTVEDRAGARVVTRIEPAAMVGTVTRVDSGRRSISIDVNGAERTYGVDDRDLLDGVRAGQRVRFDAEERSGGRWVITALRRD